MNKLKVAVIVRDGIVQTVASLGAADVFVLDYDILEEELDEVIRPVMDGAGVSVPVIQADPVPMVAEYKADLQKRLDELEHLFNT